MDIPLHAKVFCLDNESGRVTQVLLDPVTERVTHVIVRDDRGPHQEYMVPVKDVLETSSDTILLDCDREKFAHYDPFISRRFVPAKEPLDAFTDDDYIYWPFVVPEDQSYVVNSRNIPAGEIAVHAGEKIVSTDGPVGVVDEFLVDPQSSGNVTHLVMRHGHLWGRKEIAIPVDAIDHIDDDRVFVKLNRKAIETLAPIPVERRY